METGTILFDFPTFQKTMQAIGADVNAADWQALVAHYREPHRHYHTDQHIAACLAAFQQYRHDAHYAAEIEVAIYFHDVIYQPSQADNEAQSVSYLNSILDRDKVNSTVKDRLSALIMATCHQAVVSDPDQQLLVDIDLGILGQTSERYQLYENQIRQEFSWVPLAQYISGRTQLLQQFLARPVIFHHQSIQTALEAEARKNLQWSIEYLASLAK